MVVGDTFISLIASENRAQIGGLSDMADSCWVFTVYDSPHLADRNHIDPVARHPGDLVSPTVIPGTGPSGNVQEFWNGAGCPAL
tara:strand:- start:2000 stop:2251 length:252 start_codon:yes stop_codon:yes gene_type:complete